MPDPPRLVDALPTLAAALRASLRREGEEALAQQVDALRVHATCDCDDPGCVSVHVAPRRDVPCGDRYRAVLPDAVISVGVCDERIEYIEDNAAIRDAGGTAARIAEYRALMGTVPARPPGE